MKTPYAEIAQQNQAILALGRTGRYSVASACREAGVSERAFYRRQEKDPLLRGQVLQAFENPTVPEGVPVPDLVTFRQETTGRDTPPHMMEWLEALEDPVVEALMILVPPEHAKTTFMEDWLTQHVCKDRTLQSIYMSKSQPTAIKRLGRIKRLLTDDAWFRAKKLRSIPGTWGPFKAEGRSDYTWSKTQIFVPGADAADRDATVEALGVENQIQGARADIIICDDIATRKNQLSAHMVEQMLDTLGQDVLSRLPPKGGKLIIVGTRVDPGDIYGHLLEADEFVGSEGRRVKLHKIIRPAITDEGRKRTLWPAKWDYETLAARREHPLMRPKVWSLTYQQQATDLPDAAFPTALLDAAKLPDPDFRVGKKPPGMRVAVGYDPAVTGTAACVALAYTPGTRVRWILDCVTDEGFQSADRIKGFLYDFCKLWGATTARVEETSWQRGFFNDLDFKRQMATLGVRVTKEQTQMNKWHPDVGVPLCADRFQAAQYVAPWNSETKPRLGPLFTELSIWKPEVGRRQTQNRVMALWLAERAVMDAEKYEGVGKEPDTSVPRYWRGRTDNKVLGRV